MVDALKQAFRSGIIAFLLFAPLTGLVLRRYDFYTAWERPAIMAGLVFVGHLIFLWVMTTPWGQEIAERLGSKNRTGILVADSRHQPKIWILAV